MILDKLLEKKDVLAYINFRKKQLKQNIDSMCKTVKLEYRKDAIQRLDSRVGELNILADLVHSGKIKKRSVEISESLNDYGRDKDEFEYDIGNMNTTITYGCNLEKDKKEKHTDAHKVAISDLCVTLGIPFSELDFE